MLDLTLIYINKLVRFLNFLMFLVHFTPFTSQFGTIFQKNHMGDQDYSIESKWCFKIALLRRCSGMGIGGMGQGVSVYKKNQGGNWDFSICPLRCLCPLTPVQFHNLFGVWSGSFCHYSLSVQIKFILAIKRCPLFTLIP